MMTLDQFRSAPGRGRVGVRGLPQGLVVEACLRAGPEVDVVVHGLFPFP